jgi:hypothetical protein
MILLGSNAFTLDSYSYLKAAKNIVTYGHTYCANWPVDPVLPERFSFRTAGYPLFLALFNPAFFGFELVFLIQNLISIITCFALALFIREEVKLSNRQAKVFLGMCLVLFPIQFWYTRQVLTEIVFQSALFFSMLFAWKWQKERSQLNLMASTILMAISLLIKPVLVYFIPLYIGYILVIGKSFFRWYHLMIFLPVLVWFSMASINKKTTGLFHYSSIAYIHNINYNVKYSLAPEFGVAMADSIVKGIHQEANKKNNLTEKVQFLNDTALTIITKYPSNMALYYLKGIIGFWLDPGRFDIYQLLNIKQDKKQSFGVFTGQIAPQSLIEKWRDYPFIIVIFMAINLLGGIVLLLSFLYLLFKPVLRKKYILFVMLVAYISIITGGVGALRFRLEILPFLLLFFAHFYKYLCHKFNTPKSNT